MRRLIAETLFETMMRRALGLDADVARYIPFTGEQILNFHTAERNLLYKAGDIANLKL